VFTRDQTISHRVSRRRRDQYYCETTGTSRSEGNQVHLESAGALNRKIIDSLQRINNNAKVITLGDLNDGPFNNSVKKR
jgi:hypothetical protein